jgi:hypothetical protein
VQWLLVIIWEGKLVLINASFWVLLLGAVPLCEMWGQVVDGMDKMN